MKIAGSVLVITATTLLGMGKVAELKNRYVQMEYLRQLFCQIQSEIRYARTPLGEIFLSIGGQAGEPYRTWLIEMSREMERKTGDTFSVIWAKGVKSCLTGCGLPGEEILRLAEFGSHFGSADAQLQIKTIEHYLAQLSLSMSELNKELGTKAKLYRCLGIMGGMLIAVMLL